MGNLLAVIVHAANIHDTVSGIEPTLFAFERYPSIRKFCADAGYRGTFVIDIDEILGIGLDISEKVKPHQWEKLTWRWVVERTFSWLNNSRRLSKDYEITVNSAEAIVKISLTQTLVNTGSKLSYPQTSPSRVVKIYFLPEISVSPTTNFLSDP